MPAATAAAANPSARPGPPVWSRDVVARGAPPEAGLAEESDSAYAAIVTSDTGFHIAVTSMSLVTHPKSVSQPSKA